MYENIIAWAVLGLVLILCLPLPRVQRFLLSLYGLGLRFGMLVLVAAAAYLWFRPAQLPSEIADTVLASPLLTRLLPEPGAPIFAICAIGLIALVVLPLIALIAVCRRSLSARERIVVTESIQVQAPPVVSESRHATAVQAQNSLPSRFGRRGAAHVMAQAGSTH
jgi:hypothetical protein